MTMTSSLIINNVLWNFIYWTFLKYFKYVNLIYVQFTKKKNVLWETLTQRYFNACLLMLWFLNLINEVLYKFFHSILELSDE